MQKLKPVLVLIIVLGLLWFWQSPPTPSVPAATAPAGAQDASRTPALPAFLPAEASDTVRLIQRNGPYPHRQDGSVFQNRERRLPLRSPGYYREFTVATPGLSHRGPRRIVTGGDPPREYWYTDDHYQSFRSFEVPR
jgi:guanyl-specific ribonuclease Sa